MIKRWIGRRLRRITQRPKNPLAGQKFLILLYHRVTELRSDPWSLGVAPRHFAEHLDIVRQHAHPIKLQQLSEGLLNGNLPNRSVVITFDDGYADNLYNAKPLLERYDVPATAFLTTGYIGHDREFWWDELDRLLLQPGTLPKVLSLSVDGGAYRWKLGKATHYSEDAAKHPYRGKVWRYAFDSRYRLYRSLWELLHHLTEEERQKVLDELLVWAEAEPAVRPTHRPLSLEEVVVLAQGDLVEVGAHTVTHPALPTLPAASQRHEILESKAQLEQILGRRVYSFAYPYGSISAETVSIVREAGFARACSSVADIDRRSVDRFRLPRIEVAGWDGETFDRQFSRWFSG